MAHPREYETLAPYRAYLFGSFQLLRNGTPIEETPRRKKAQKILQWFLLNPGRVVSADELVDLFWPHGSPAKGLGNFHVTMHCLRRMLEPDLGPRQDSAFVVRHATNFYSFDTRSVWWTDVADVDLLFSRGNQSDLDGDPQQACFYYRRLTEYCRRGMLVEEWSGEEWLAPYRERYRQVHIQSLMRLMRYYREAGARDELVGQAYEMLGLDACNEMANEIVIKSLLTSGNVRAAARQLERFARLLQDELGMPLPREFHGLRQRIAKNVGAPHSIYFA